MQALAEASDAVLAAVQSLKATYHKALLIAAGWLGLRLGIMTSTTPTTSTSSTTPTTTTTTTTTTSAATTANNATSASSSSSSTTTTTTKHLHLDTLVHPSARNLDAVEMERGAGLPSRSLRAPESRGTPGFWGGCCWSLVVPGSPFLQALNGN